ncbi:leucyl/phenylalanyl-tRNA--protein transferase [Hyphomicrobium zavarzinii]|uniref:leucyl/phenylalanyl-tRNA--protein transferase n=1 Tax=Hyphomicrobium zavarzinii TaxID=48292 RepID=UPI00036184D9|nr:leucyl/phenylalanyl-tRNA--protein transferase [Hyphomicrobium zavarzinii]
MNAEDTTPRETWSKWIHRWILGLAYAARPGRIGDLPSLIWHSALDIARGGTVVPDASRTASRPDTFAGICRDISALTMIEAARKGFFAWAHCGPLKWWTREKRMALVFNEHKLEKRCLREMKKNAYRVSFDTAFETVVRECAAPRAYNWHTLTWITPLMQRLYRDLHRLGYAHSFEIWNADGKLVGGGFGISIGRVFLSDSLFSRERDVSKMVSSALYYHLAKWGYVLCDGRDYTPMQDAMGYREISRADYEAILAKHAHTGGRQGRWVAEADLATVAQWVSANKRPAIAGTPGKTSVHETATAEASRAA